jgi:predicted AlkP superfamily phosphohydrolase/phosphomutase
VDEDTLIIVLSDHGMGSFERGFHLNSWLHQNGYLSLKSGAKPGPGAGDLLGNVDWSRTKAYGIGLGAIYLNLRGREGEGIVEECDSHQVKSEITRRLTGLKDTEKGQVAIRSVATSEELYRGPHVELAPDLMVNFAPGYRVSWDTPLGGIPDGLFEDNRKKWSGDHVIDPSLVPGILLVNRPLCRNEAALVDLAPTILRAFGMPENPELEGTSLL